MENLSWQRSIIITPSYLGGCIGLRRLMFTCMWWKDSGYIYRDMKKIGDVTWVWRSNHLVKILCAGNCRDSLVASVSSDMFTHLSVFKLILHSNFRVYYKNQLKRNYKEWKNWATIFLKVISWLRRFSFFIKHLIILSVYILFLAFLYSKS